MDEEMPFHSIDFSSRSQESSIVLHSGAKLQKWTKKCSSSPGISRPDLMNLQKFYISEQFCEDLQFTISHEARPVGTYCEQMIIHLCRSELNAGIGRELRAVTGAGAESSDSTPASGRAALDGATRKTLCCASSETSLLGCLPGEGDI